MRFGEQIERLIFMFKINVLGQRFEYLIPVLQATTSDGKAHYRRYFFAQRFCKGKNVLDIACGAGYGAKILSEVAEKVVGVDRDRNAINYALKHYKAQNLSFVCASVEGFKIDEGKYDVIVCFETLEHLDDDKAFIDSLPVNTLVIFSVPDKNYAWTSPFRKRAYDKKILEERFGNFKIEYFFQHPNGEIDDVETDVQNIIGVCKNS
jgi:ubiquinone/menaquinone biosynthesis C-methylase UbiE